MGLFGGIDSGSMRSAASRPLLCCAFPQNSPATRRPRTAYSGSNPDSNHHRPALASLDTFFSDNDNVAPALAVVGYLGFLVSCTYASAICVAVSVHFNEQRYPSLWRYHAAVLILSVSFFCLIWLLPGDDLTIESFDIYPGNTGRNWIE